MSKRQKSDDTPAEAGPRLYFAGTKQYYTSVESFFQVVCDAQRKGKAKYWRKVTPRRRDNSVHLECQDCGNLLSARNPADSCGSHFKEHQGALVCKRSVKIQDAVVHKARFSAHAQRQVRQHLCGWSMRECLAS